MASLPKLRRSRLSAHTPAPAERTEADVQRLEAFGLAWLNIENPMALDAQWLTDNFSFHELDIEDVLSRRQQRSKIDVYDDYVFIVLHFPRFDKRTQRMQAAELDIFLAEDLLITLPSEPLKPLSAMWAQLSTREEERARHMSKGSAHLMYELVDRLFDYCFPILGKIGHKLEWIEDQIFEDRGGEEVVRDISNTKQEIINFRKIIKPQRPTLRGLERYTERYAVQDLELYFDDIVDKNERIWDELENFKEVVEALSQTNEAVLRQNQENLIRVLTLLSAILLPLTLVTGFYGMNVRLPFAGHWWSAVFVAAVMVAIGGAFVWIFHRKRWL